MGNLSLVVTRHSINLFTLYGCLTELLPHVLAEREAEAQCQLFAEQTLYKVSAFQQHTLAFSS